MFFKKYDIFPQIRAIFSRLTIFEKNLERTNDKLEDSINQLKSCILRMNNGEKLSNELIKNTFTYKDLTPHEAALELKSNNINYFILDVSSESFQDSFTETHKIPLDELIKRRNELPEKIRPILVISENGVDSILACKILISLEYLYVNNISGGYKFLRNSNHY